MRRMGVAAVLAGCGRIGFGDVARDATSDASPCVMPALYDDFTGTTACGWGTTHNITNSDVYGGALHAIPPVPGTNVGAQCSANNFSFDRGSFIDVASVPTQTSDYVELQIFLASHNLQLLYYADINDLELSDEATNRGGLAAAPYDPIAMRWWALRPVSSSELVAQYSADGVTWTQFGPIKDISADALSGLLVFGAGYYATESVASTTTFQHWNVCP